jgi:hypothetical protein
LSELSWKARDFSMTDVDNLLKKVRNQIFIGKYYS